MRALGTRSISGAGLVGWKSASREALPKAVLPVVNYEDVAGWCERSNTGDQSKGENRSNSGWTSGWSQC